LQHKLFLNTLRVVQSNISKKKNYIAGYTTRNVKDAEHIITGCTICNIFIF